MWDNSEQVKLLDSYRGKYGNFRVATHFPTHWRHMTYGDEECEYYLRMEREYRDAFGITDRQVFKDEVVIESDMNMRSMNKAVSEEIERKMVMHNYSFQKWFTTNKSYHMHAFFPELMFVNNDDDLKLLKELFIKFIHCDAGVGCTLGGNGHAGLCNLLKHKVDLQLTGKHLIRVEYGEHPTTGGRKYLVSESETDAPNKLPREVWEQFSKIKNYYRIYKRKRSSFDMPCVKYLFSNAVPDGRKRVGFILYKNLKLQFGSVNAEIMLREWNTNINSNYLTSLDIAGILKSGKDSSQAPSHRYISRVLSEICRLDVCKYCEAEVN